MKIHRISQEFPFRSHPAIHENGKWTGIATGIFLTVWLIVAILKMAGRICGVLSVSEKSGENESSGQ